MDEYLLEDIQSHNAIQMESTDYAINREGVSAAFVQAEREKSTLILEAQLLRAQGQHQTAASRFAAAAQIEERLSDMLRGPALQRKYFIHRFSALSCWAQAGNVYQAITMGEELLAAPDLPEALRQQVQAYVQRVRTYLERWTMQFVPELSVAVPA